MSGTILSPSREVSAIQAEKFHTDGVNLPRIQASLPNGYTTLYSCIIRKIILFELRWWTVLTVDVFKLVFMQRRIRKLDAWILGRLMSSVQNLSAWIADVRWLYLQTKKTGAILCSYQTLGASKIRAMTFPLTHWTMNQCRTWFTVIMYESAELNHSSN